MATKEEAGGAGVGAAVSDEEHAGFVAAPPLPVPTDAAGAASVAEVASGVVPVAHGSGDVDVDVGVPKLSVTSASGVEVEVPIDGGRSRSSTTTASSSSTTPPLGTTTKQPKKKPSGIAMAPVTEPVMKDTIDSPVFEMGSPKPPPSLKAFVHAIEAGQAIWERQHPSVVNLRRDEDLNGIRTKTPVPASASLAPSPSGAAPVPTFQREWCDEEEADRAAAAAAVGTGLGAPTRELRSGVYIGLEVEFNPYPHFCVYVHDGFFALDYFVERVPMDDPNGTTPPTTLSAPTPKSFSYILAKTTAHIISWLRHYSLASEYKLFACGFSLRSHSSSSGANRLALSKPGRASDLAVVDLKGGRKYPMRLPSVLWREFDCLPVVVETRGETIEERAGSACRKMLTFITPSAIGPIPRISLTPTHSVQVDLNARIHLADLSDYARLSSRETWRALSELASEAREAGRKILWFNSTAQGGGVALMRHALVRLMKKLGVDARWFVMKPDPKVYEITKRKFHNVLQGVSKDPPTDADKKLFERWSKINLERYFKAELLQADVIVLDDPQVLGMMPHIRALVPGVKIIFRCHIEIRTDLLADPTSAVAQVWNYLWSFARHADLFVFHPVKGFIPTEVPRERTVVMSPTTDPLDGLNKPLAPADVHFYLRMLNRIAYDQCHRRLDLNSGRGYLCQVARFDPSKGIGELLDSYRVMREKLVERGWPVEKTPQLLITGHGSVDDPDAMRVYHECSEKIKSEPFKRIAKDIIPVRLPPSDQLLSAALAGSLFALQLSKREGFEVKVSEALHKAKPVVVSNAGGIPHQVIHGKNGFIVPFGDIEMTAMRMEQLVTDEKLLGKMREYAAGCVNEEFFTQFVAVNWLYMARGLVDGTLVGRVEVAFQEAQEEQVSERPTPEWKATGFSDGPADSVRAIDGVVFDYDHIETEEEYRARRTAMAGPSPWIYKLWQAEMLGEDRRDQARCLQTEGVASFCREDFKQGKMLAPGEIVGGQAEMERGRSWDLESEKSEISEWGTLDDEEATGELGLDAPTD